MSTPPFSEILAGRGILLLERVAGRTFAALGVQPAWFRMFARGEPTVDAPLEPGAIFPFLDHFLDDAERFWARPDGGEIRSGTWTENSPGGPDCQFEAVACTVDGKDYLVVSQLTTGFEQLQRVYQTGRELLLTHERLVAEIGKKEILLHCIIHDLSGPLHGMMGALQVASAESQSANVKQLIEFGLIAAKSQSNLISDLLDTFRAEEPSFEALPSDSKPASDIIATAREVVDMLQPVFSIRQMATQFLPPPDVGTLRVVAEKSRLERVFHNLLQNATRYSPKGSTIRISIRDDEGFVRVGVEDEGPGVPPDVVPQLFQKFVRHGPSTGKAGLGLFFCRISVEQWGGSIGCEPRPGGGTTFWFRLPRLE